MTMRQLAGPPLVSELRSTPPSEIAEPVRTSIQPTDARHLGWNVSTIPR